MSIKLNGATNGSVELDVPAAIGSDLSVTIPATAGDIVVKGTDGSVDLGAIDIAASAPADSVNIDSSGRLLVGTSTSSATAKLVVEGQTTAPQAGAILKLQRGEAPADITIGEGLGNIEFAANDGSIFAQISAQADADAGASDYPGRLLFLTTADGASSPTERMRIHESGAVTIGKTDRSTTVAGVVFEPVGLIGATRSANPPCAFNRLTNDGVIVNLLGQSTIEGTISVSGSTVSYNGAHLARWSQLPGGVERTEILRGSVLSNIDEMCEWGDEENEQLNRMQVSSVEGDLNVSGVFDMWDDDDDTYTNDFYCAMTGDFIIRIAQGVTVQRGDLLMSAGDGTAKPQDDDIIRSKTVAKVTSTHVTCTYDDGSYCVPCVLMAC